MDLAEVAMHGDGDIRLRIRDTELTSSLVGRDSIEGGKVSAMRSANHAPVRLAGRIAALAVIAFVVVGCARAGPGAGIADKIRAANSPIVREVFLSPANPFEGRGDEITVFLTDGATEAEALDLWCTVIIPAGAGQLPPPGVRLEQGTRPWVGGGLVGGHRVLTDNPICPGDGSPAPTG